MPNIGRWLWYFSLAAMACIATVVQVDRHAHEVPELARWVPDRFRSFTLIRQAASEAAIGTPRRAVDDARRLILSHPIPAENLTILSIAEHKVGNEAGSAEAMTLAAQRGWREPLAQQSVALAAAQAGEGEIAAARLSALWRTETGIPYAREITMPLLDLPDVRIQFGSKLASQKEWVPSFLNWASGNLPPSIFVDLVEEANEKGAKFDCVLMSRAARAMLQQGALSLAQGLWDSQCGAQLPSFQSDLAFSGPKATDDKIQGPFSWTFPSSVGLVVDRSIKDGGGIDFDNRDPIRRLLAIKYLALPPGKHVVRVAADSMGPSPRPMLARIQCYGDASRNAFQALEHNVSDGPFSFIIPNDGCEVQSLSLLVDEGKGKNVRVILEED